MMPERNRKKSELDSENGSTTGRRVVQRWNHGTSNVGRECDGFERSHWRPDNRRRSIDAAGGNSRRINTAAGNYRICGLFRGTAVVRIDISSEIGQAHHRRSSGEGDQD